MKRAFLRLALIAALATPAIASAAAPSSPRTCDRTCLATMLDRFLGAVIAHDPTRAPLAIGFRQTQNSVLTPAGAGAWRTITAMGPVQRRYFDPVTGNAEFFGLVTDNGQPAILSIRLHVANAQITESEWHIAHKGDPGISGKGSDVLFDPDTLTANPPPQRVVPRTQRLPRETLTAIVDSYFDALTAGSGRTALAHPGCQRFENGFAVFGHPIRSGDPNDGYRGLSDCTSGYKGLSVATVAARRYLAIDEEAQVVIVSAVFVRKAGDARRRLHFMEMFGIDGGRIRSVHAAMFYPDPDLPVPNWPPYDGNFPLVVNSAPTK
jgi:hypothetical protein